MHQRRIAQGSLTSAWLTHSDVYRLLFNCSGLGKRLNVLRLWSELGRLGRQSCLPQTATMPSSHSGHFHPDGHDAFSHRVAETSTREADAEGVLGSERPNLLRPGSRCSRPMVRRGRPTWSSRWSFRGDGVLSGWMAC